MTEILLMLGGVAVGVLLTCWRLPGGFMKNVLALRGGGPGEEGGR